MSRTLKISGFVALTLQMLWGIVNSFLASPGGPGLTAIPTLVGAHAHFGMLSILAVVAGYAVEEYGLAGTRRAVTEWCYIAGQWLLPGTLVLAGLGGAFAILHMTAFLWGALLTVSMGSLALAAVQH